MGRRARYRGVEFHTGLPEALKLLQLLEEFVAATLQKSAMERPTPYHQIE